MVVLKRLMARGQSECVAAALEKHGEPKIMHVIQRVYAPQKAKVSPGSKIQDARSCPSVYFGNKSQKK